MVASVAVRSGVASSIVRFLLFAPADREVVEEGDVNACMALLAATHVAVDAVDLATPLYRVIKWRAPVAVGARVLGGRLPRHAPATGRVYFDAALALICALHLSCALRASLKRARTRRMVVRHEAPLSDRHLDTTLRMPRLAFASTRGTSRRRCPANAR